MVILNMDQVKTQYNYVSSSTSSPIKSQDAKHRHDTLSETMARALNLSIASSKSGIFENRKIISKAPQQSQPYSKAIFDTARSKLILARAPIRSKSSIRADKRPHLRSSKRVETKKSKYHFPISISLLLLLLLLLLVIALVCNLAGPCFGRVPSSVYQLFFGPDSSSSGTTKTNDFDQTSLPYLIEKAQDKLSCFDLSWLHNGVFYLFVSVSMFIVGALCTSMFY